MRKVHCPLCMMVATQSADKTMTKKELRCDDPANGKTADIILRSNHSRGLTWGDLGDERGTGGYLPTIVFCGQVRHIDPTCLSSCFPTL